MTRYPATRASECTFDIDTQRFLTSYKQQTTKKNIFILSSPAGKSDSMHLSRIDHLSMKPQLLVSALSTPTVYLCKPFRGYYCTISRHTQRKEPSWPTSRSM